MKQYIFLLLLCFSLSIHAQITNVNNSPFRLVMIPKKNGNIDTSESKKEIAFSGVIYEGQEYDYYMVNNDTSKKESYYLSMVEFNPEGNFQVMIPWTDWATEPEEFMVRNGADQLIGSIGFDPPYGYYKTVVILTQNRDLMISLAKFKANDSLRNIRKYEPERIREELYRVLRGVPSIIFRDAYLCTIDYLLLPKPSASGTYLPEGLDPSYRSKAYRAGPNVLPISKPITYLQPSDTSCTNRMYTEPALLFSRYPMLTFINPAPDAEDFKRGAHVGKSTVNTRYVIQGNVSAAKGVKEVRINGETAILKKLNPVQFFWEKEVTLKPGSNSFNISAITEEGAANCDRVELTYEPDNRNVNVAGKNYLLLIGINKYKNWKPLTGAVNDLHEIHKLMLDFGFKEKQITELTDENATQDAIDSAFSSLQSILGPNDNLLIYYAGHGILDRQLEGRGYWVPVGARKDKRNDFIANEYIKDFLQSFKARHVLIFADACFSGSLFRNSRGEESYTKRVEQLNSRWVFCSGREEVVDDVLAGKKNSPFAYYLINALRKLAPGEKLSISELALKVSRDVADAVKQTPVSGPLREAGDEGGEFMFERIKK